MTRRHTRTCALMVVVYLLLSACAGSSNSPKALKPLGVDGQWTLKFNDEFNNSPTKDLKSSSVDRNKWSFCFQNKTTDDCEGGKKESQWYNAKNAVVDGGHVSLVATKETINAKPYSSAMLTTANAKFDFKYGYIEARVRVPKGQALWPAVWLLPTNGEWLPEIDVMEFVGGEPNKIHMAHHWGTDEKIQSDDKVVTGADFPSDFSADWHTFGVNWQADSLTWYLDGKRARSVSTKGIPQTQMYLILDLAVGGKLPGDPTDATPNRSEFLVDYVRVWQQ